MLKNVLLLTVAVFCLGNSSCDLVSLGNQFNFNVPFQLSVNEIIQSADGKLKIAFMEVLRDSRCPEDVVCITAGNAEILLGIDTGNAQMEITLNTTDGTREQSVNDWVIRLLELQPQTRSDRTIESGDYTVTLQVEH